MSEHIDVPVLIIGGGPTGLVAGLCLRQLGVPCLILERHSAVAAHPKAHELSGRSIEILHSLGLGYEELAAEASPAADASRIVFCDTLAEEYGHIDLSEGPSAALYAESLASPWPFLNLSQVELERVLHRHVERAAGVSLRWQHQWESFEQQGDQVLSQVTDLSTGQPLTVRSRYVLCADGAASRSRRALGVEMEGPDQIRDVVNVAFDADLSDLVKTRGKLYFCLTPEVPGATFIAHHIARRWVFNLPLLGGRSAEDYSDEQLLALARRALGREDVTLSLRSRSAWRMTAQVAQRFRVGRAFLVGDAAHRFPPTGGLGMNSGIADAQNLCWKLAAVLNGRAPDALLDSYELERRPVVKRNCEQSHRNYERLLDVVRAFGLEPDQIEAALRHLEQGPLARLPESGQTWLRRQANRYGASVYGRFHTDPAVRAEVLQAIDRQRPHFDRAGLELGYAYEEGALLPDGTPPLPAEPDVSIYRPSTRPGARFPHFWLDGRRRRRSSTSLLSPGTSTLILGRDVQTRPGEEAALAEICARHAIELRFLDEDTVAPACLGLAHQRSEIALHGALLVRPDQHVAWRQREGVRLSVALIASILEQCYGAPVEG